MSAPEILQEPSVAKHPMVRAKCPAALRKYGFCGLLATVYAARLPMPSNLAGFRALLAEVKQVLSLGKDKWGKTLPKHTGAISLPQTVALMTHYRACEFHVTHHAQGPTLRKWLKDVLPRTCYIVHLRKHAIFVEVGAVRSKWRVYDQGGAYTKCDCAYLDKKYGGSKVREVIVVTYQ